MNLAKRVGVLYALAMTVASAQSQKIEVQRWIDNSSLFAFAMNRTKTRIPLYEVKLDAPPSERWTHVAKDFKEKVPDVLDYLYSFIPKWAEPIIQIIGKSIRPYFSDYGDEMKGLADGLGMDLGEIVVINLIYQLENIGINCSNWNNTGPTRKDDPGCVAVDPDQSWCYCKENKDYIREDGSLRPHDVPSYNQRIRRKRRIKGKDGPGLCTSIVARSTEGNIYHARNLDWNLPEAILKMAVDVNFTRRGKTVFIGTTLVGFVGVLNGMVPGGYSSSMNARGKGGKIIDNLLEALLHHGMTPSQHLRKVLEQETEYDKAISSLASGPLIDEIYYATAGVSGNEGAIVTRDRDTAADVWALNSTDFFRVETNYDHWNPVPKSDDRRSPAVAGMKNLTTGGVNFDGMLSVVAKWPVFNAHTDYTSVMIPFNGTYESWIWLEE
mmetsp:Transcript_12615/g.18875  ORF Transcript_12615/g.18875 Transcript_12615/m.18875 type:complete len:439 (+) Transcript_12615:34-1350(+)